MICPRCGAQNHDTAPQCRHCGWALAGAGTPPTGQPQPPPRQAMGDDAAMRLLLPVGRSWVAIVAGYFGLFSLVVFPAPIALLLGIAAVFHIKSHPGKHGMGRAIFAIVMGALGSLVLLLVIISAHH